MTGKLILITTLVISCTVVGRAQYQPEPGGSVPIYRVTVVDRTVSAVDYQYRNGPTQIDFRGTVLLPHAKGDAIVESKAGRIEIDAHFDRLLAPTRFGPEYLTYVLWAITPEGHAKNLGEVLPGSSDKAKLRVTTDLQAFGLIVTAEPYSAVRQPSDVVVMENQIRPDTSGRTEPIQAKYELLPRGQYTYNVPEGLSAAEASAPKLSWDQYQSVVELYQAQNAVQIAQSVGADSYAPDTLGKAAELLRQAQDAQARKAGMTTVVTLARQASQTAEDARILAMQRKQNDELASARDQAAKSDALRAQAEAAAQTAQTQAAAEHALLEQERAAKHEAEAEAAAAASAAPPPPPPQPVVMTQPATSFDNPQKKAVRVRLLEQFNVALPGRDTPRGIVLTLPDAYFQETRVNPAVYERLARVAAIISANPGLTVEIDGHERFSTDRAEAVRDLLVRDGVPVGATFARGMGDARPLVSNATAAGREENHRVEIIISGSPIGDMPYWARSYSVAPQQ
jgi:flagellar motor protein MotB